MITVLFTVEPERNGQVRPFLTKVRTMVDGQIVKTDYGKAYRFHAFEFQISNILELSGILLDLENDPYACVIRGRLKADSDGDAVRRLAYDDLNTGEKAAFEDRPEGVHWVLIDFDKIPCPAWVPANLRREYLLEMLPEWFHGATYHYRWSGSAGLDGWETLSCHFWFWLTEPWTSAALRERMEIEKADWDGVDRSLMNAVQIHYTAAPIFYDMADPVHEPRSALVRRERDAVKLPPYSVPAKSSRELERASRIDSGYAGITSVQGFEAKFASMLDAIGPNYHIPIRSAAAYYPSHAPEFDRAEIKSRLQDAILFGAPGKSDKSIYDSKHLDRTIDGAVSKFRARISEK